METHNNDIVMVEFSLLPIGEGVSVSKYVAACQHILKTRKVEHEMHAMGTNLIGTWQVTMQAIDECRRVVHDMGADRVSVSVKIDSRRDKAASFANKVASVTRLTHD
ncbi:hypothetical protein BDF19DRAFT_450348 [Syncephalis fuscata]|nr:hypothetical protein BDF19DRAFT_450348 [Syncephalis fuscata]